MFVGPLTTLTPEFVPPRPTSNRLMLAARCIAVVSTVARTVVKHQLREPSRSWTLETKEVVHPVSGRDMRDAFRDFERTAGYLQGYMAALPSLLAAEIILWLQSHKEEVQVAA